MNSFTFQTAPSLVFGFGILNQLGEWCANRLGDRIVVITDPGLVKNGLIERVVHSLNVAGIRHFVYSDVKADPPADLIIEAARFASEKQATGIIGFGGGSSLDVSKLVAVLANGTPSLEELYGINNISTGRLPILAIPTTAGTGSEVTPIAIVTTGTCEKKGVVSPTLIPDVALLDAELTIGLPAHITAATGINAMVHAIEAYASTSVNNNVVSRLLAKEALSLLGSSIEKAVHEGHNAAMRGNMLLGSMLAGQAFANSPLAAVHALSYPLAGHFNIPQGLSNALVLPHVLRFNSEVASDVYSEIAPFAFSNLADLDKADCAFAFADELAALSTRCGLPRSLREVDVSQESLPQLANDAIKQTRLLGNNPRKLTEQDILGIYEAAF